ncbi:aldehyde dehydrogenase family protein [Croceicoccus sediminis]|uniref:aldehyde dehydrogenase family protein n=1 Tax=Croceicoccus sediminis TaxID=2571150 RepID=UPI00196A9EEE|nr:aldehyde dehydrogenase family protein [Croceicoccus sediminis]
MALPDATRYYIDGQWTDPVSARMAEVVDPATASPVAPIALGSAADAERAILAARRAFPDWSNSSVALRLDLLRKILAGLIARKDEIGDAISAEMGAPTALARSAQAGSGPQHFAEVIRVLESYEFSQAMGTTLIRREPIGVCTLITPWNWPMNQVATKVAPALAAGCTMVLKPSELAPLDAVILAEIIDEAGVPPGVFNLVHGTGEDMGATLTGHPEVDMVSFTGSTRAGIAIGENAAKTVKRVSLELGGKSAVIVLPDADLDRAVTDSVSGCMFNSGQSCNAGTRLLVPADRLEEAKAAARTAAQACDIGPIANKAQYGRVIGMIEGAIAEGAELVAGGPEKAEGQTGYQVAPTVLASVTPDMTVAREEVFGPVIAIMTYDSVEQAIAIANDSPYGLSGYVWGADRAEAGRVAASLRTGMVHVNGAGLDSAAPFGGYKMSGNGREWGVYGLEEFLEVKSVFGGVEANS